MLGVTIAHDDIIQKNYENIVQKAKVTLNAWYNRSLSLIGKVQVVNTLIASLFAYKMMVLPIIPVHIVKQVENMIRDYLWGGKKSKIALKILQNPKDKGGLNLVDLTRKDISLKATWPQILHHEQDYASLVYKQLRCSMLGDNIWRCRLCREDIKELKIKNQFWKDVLKCWSEYNYHHDFRVENQLIWYNSNIRIKNRPFMWNDIYSKGLSYVYQLFENMNWKSYESVKEQYGLSELRYNSLKCAIPTEWKELFMQVNRLQYLPVAPHSYDMCTVKHVQLSRKIYRYISEDEFLIQNKYAKWQQEIGFELCENLCDFAKQHCRIYTVTNVLKYRSFQYRTLQRGLVTNIHLFRWGMIESENCTFCGKYKETTSHMLFLCEKVQVLWTQFYEYILKRFPALPVDIGEREVILNQLVKNKNLVVNFMCLITKQYIYRQRCKRKELKFIEIENIISLMENIEKYIAIKNQKVTQHNRKWYVTTDQQDQVIELDGQNVDLYIQQYLSQR